MHREKAVRKRQRETLPVLKRKSNDGEDVRNGEQSNARPSLTVKVLPLIVFLPLAAITPDTAPAVQRGPQ